METRKRSPLVAIVLAVVIGLMVIALLNGVIRPTQVVVAKVAIAPGTILSDQLVELRTIPMGAKPADALTKVEDAAGKMLAVGRAPGDLVVQSVLGEIAGAGIPAELPDGHVAMAINVDQASGIAGLLRPGQTVTIIGMLSPDFLKKIRSVLWLARSRTLGCQQPLRRMSQGCRCQHRRLRLHPRHPCRRLSGWQSPACGF